MLGSAIGFYKQDGVTRPVHAPRSKRGYSTQARGRVANSRRVRMPKELQIQLLRKRFGKLNPEVGVDMIDWEAAVGGRESFHETLQDLKEEYPMYRWDRRDTERSHDELAARSLRRELEGFGYVSLRKGELARIRKDRRRYEEWVAAREKLRQVHGVRVNVDEHIRRWPRG